MKLHKVRQQLDAQDANLAGSRFDDVNLHQALFNNVNLREAKFSDVNFSHASIDDANLSHMAINGVLVSDLLAAYWSRSGAVLFAKDIELLRAFYQAVLGIDARVAAADHAIIDAPRFRLVIHGIPAAIAANIEIANPPKPRADTAIKLSFEVASLSAARECARQHGGELHPADREWDFQGLRICDGTDPEGNVVQFLERAGK